MILVDLGISYKKLKEKAQENSIDLNKVNTIFLTHEHSDHIKGLRVFLNNHPTTNVITSKGTMSALDFPINNYLHVKQNEILTVDNFKLETIPLSHDVNEPLGLIINVDNNRHVHITDTGYINQSTMDRITGANSYLLESNYDDEMIMGNERYPFLTKKRIMSNKGHLSNVQCVNYLDELVTENTKSILIGHISENNNHEDIIDGVYKHIEEKDMLTVLKAEETVVIKDVW